MTTLIPKFDLMNGSATPTSAVNRAINLKLAETVSVKDFGATGDGTTDDTTAIQAAINAMILGGNIYFLAKIGATDGNSFQKLASLMTGMPEESYRQMMIAGGRSPSMPIGPVEK